MSSKVIGFRVPEDIADDLERYCSEQDITTADFLRDLVDDILYPSRSTQTPPGIDPLLIEKINELGNTQNRLTDQFGVLSTRVDKLTECTGQMKREEPLGPGQEEPLTSATDLVKQVEDLKDSHGMLFKMLEDNADKIQRIFNLFKSYKSSTDSKNTELRSEINNLRSQIDNLVLLSSKLSEAKADIDRLIQNVTSIKSSVKPRPTGDIYTLTYKDGSDHKFKIYEDRIGLIRPKIITRDPFLGNKYIDLSEPLD